MLLETIRFWLNRFETDKKGVTTVEYAIMLALIVLVAVAAIGGIGGRVEFVYDNIDTGFANAGL